MIVKKCLRLLRGGLVIAIASGSGQGAGPHTNLVSITAFGAIGDGVHDDTPAIQSAINDLELRGGGTLRVPAGTYLLNSYSPSPHPWFFYNLRAGSNVMISADPGAIFLQGPNGRSPLVPGATEVRNSVLVFGTSNYVITTFQNPDYNGGFYPLQATTANQASVTLASPSNASKFSPGSYVAIYSATAGDVIPSETSQVISVSGSGVLNLKYPLARSFSAPSIANVTSLATVNVGVQNLVVQGAEPLAVTEVFGFTATGNTFTTDTSIGGNNTYGLNMNTVRSFTFTGNLINSVGPSYVDIQLPQRNSQNGTFLNNNFIVSSVGFGEYGAHWTFSKNNFWLYTDATAPAALPLGGLDVTFNNNYVFGIATAVPLVADYVGLDFYAQYVGQIKIMDNVVQCQAEGSNCLILGSSDPVVSNNTITATGNAVGIKVQGPIPQSATISGNNISVGASLGIVLNTFETDNSTVSCNHIQGSGPYGLYIASPAAPNTGVDTITANVISGFASPIYMDPSVHPATLITYTGVCPK